jgi:hypothetical protein
MFYPHECGLVMFLNNINPVILMRFYHSPLKALLTAAENRKILRNSMCIAEGSALSAKLGRCQEDYLRR